MAKFVLLGNFTEQGASKLEKVPNADTAARRLIENLEGKLQIFYTIGEYDFVAFVELPSDVNMLELLLKMKKIGDVRTKTMKAWSESEFHEIVQNFEA